MSLHGTKRASQHSVRPRASLLLRYKFPNPYINYLTEYLRNPANKCQGTQRKMFKMAAQRWHQLSPEERAPYHDCAEYNKRQMALQRAHTANKERRRKRMRKICSNCGHRSGQKQRTINNTTNHKSAKKSSKRSPDVKKECRTSPGRGGRRDARDDQDGTDCSADELFESESVASSVSSF